MLSATLLMTALSMASVNTGSLTGRFGINLSGCEFEATGALCPNASDIDWYMDQGFTVIRVPFRGSLPAAKLYPIVDRIVARGGFVILDRHDFTWPRTSDQVTYWTNLIAPYKQNIRVVIDVMNEPQGFNDPTLPNGYMQWARDANQIIAGLRANGAGNMILMEWPEYSSGLRADLNEAANTECKSAMCALDRSGGLKDPLGRTMLSPHLYFDTYSTGTVATCGKALTLDKVRAAAEKRGYRLFLGESAFGSYRGVSGTCAGVATAAVTEIKAHANVWAGVTWWGGGRAWKEDYVFKTEPLKGTRAAAPASAYVRWIAGE